MKKPLIIALISIVVIALLGITIYFVQSKNSSNIQSQNNAAETIKEETKTVDLTELHKKHLSPVRENLTSKDVEYETDIYKVIFDTKGASVKSIILKKYNENE